MKKTLKVLFVIVMMALVVLACYCAYRFFTKEKVEEKKENVQTEQISTEPMFTLENYPKVDASLATQPLTNAFIKNFTGENVNTDELEYSNTHPGYIKLIDGEVDLIVVTEPSEDELKYAEEKGVELEVIPVVKEGFVFFVNEDNPVDSLTFEQIQKIYTGEITNWSEVGGNDAKIRAFQRNVNSGSQTGMLSLVMKGLDLMEPVKEDRIGTMIDIVNEVADYDNGMDSIGYSYYYYAATMYDDIDKDVADRIKLLGVNGVVPSYETIKDNSYPIQTAYYIVINKNEPEDSSVRKLANAMLSERGQQVAKEAGYVPVK